MDHLWPPTAHARRTMEVGCATPSPSPSLAHREPQTETNTHLARLTRGDWLISHVSCKDPRFSRLFHLANLYLVLLTAAARRPTDAAFARCWGCLLYGALALREPHDSEHKDLNPPPFGWSARTACVGDHVGEQQRCLSWARRVTRVFRIPRGIDCNWPCFQP